MTPTDNPQLVAELVLATVGLQPILDGSPKWTKSAQDDADKYLARARAEVLRFLSGASDKSANLPDFDFAELSKLLNESGEKQQAALRAALPPELVDAVEAVATRIVHQLQAMLPRRVRKSAVKVTVEPPAPIELDRLRRVWNVANDPNIVLQDLLEGSLSPDQVAAFEQFYPAIYQAIAGEGGVVDDSIATMKSRRGENWDIDEDRDRQLRTLLRADSMDLGLASDYARVRQQQAQGQPQGQPRARAVNSKLTDAEQLPGQRNLNP